MNTDKKKTILIIERDYKDRLRLKSLLQDEFAINFALNAKEGYYYAGNILPDLLIGSCIDGTEIYKKLLSNPKTSYLPVLFTADENTQEIRNRALKAGALGFFSKPFDSTELKHMVKNILNFRENVIKKYREDMSSALKIQNKKTADEIFLEKLIAEVNLRVDHRNFKMNELANSLHMSYSTLYRKCNSLTGKNLVDFVRSFRLKKALVIMAKYGYSIKEISLQVGFHDPKYFSRCFKKEFGQTPKKFKKNLDLTDIDQYLEKYDLQEIIRTV